MNITINGETVKKYLEDYPDVSTRTLSRMIYKDNQALFSDEEQVRTIVRYYRGASGKGNLRTLKDKKFVRESSKGNVSFPSLLEGIVSIDDWKIHSIEGSHRILRLSDIHIPYHSKNILEIAVNKGKEFNSDIILLDGDISDCYAISQWNKDPRKRDFSKELDIMLSFFEWLRFQFPKARIIWKLGNHEERFENYLMIKAPELYGVNKFSYASVYETDQYGIEIIKDKMPIKLNKLHTLHGHEYKFAISNPVSPARGLFLRAKVNAICGHFHQTSTHSEPSLSGKIIATWSTGCLCDLHPDYMPINKWEHGFAEIETEGNEEFQIHNYKIIDNKIYLA